MTFTAYRLTNIAGVVRLWEFFQVGISYEAKYLRYQHSMDVYRKILCSLVRDSDKGWVAVAMTEDEIPVAFIMAHDSTPLFAEDREFEVSMFYYKPGFKEGLHAIQKSLDRYCEENGIVQYYITSSSKSGSAQRVFNTAWHGLELSNMVFKRKI